MSCTLSFPAWAIRLLALSAGALALSAAAPVAKNVDLSGDHPNLAASVPVVAIDPAHPRRVAVAWRFINPFDRAAPVADGNWVCHVSLSRDGGASFSDQMLHWGLAALPRCNAPFVAFSPDGTLTAGATLSGPPPAPGVHPEGAVGIERSRDFGRDWSGVVKPIASNMLDRFDVGPEIPLQVRQVPWDGARGVFDPQTGALIVSGSFPARPGSPEFSQRFYAISTDGGAHFGPIRSFADGAWPERWDGDLAASHGLLAVSYIAAATPDPSAHCPCAVFGVSRDGRRFERHLVAPAAAFDLDTLVHYPEVAADPAHAGRFAVVLIDQARAGVTAYLTGDSGEHWQPLAAPLPPDVASVSRPATAFTPEGTLLLAWRGYHRDGGYDIYLQAARGGPLSAPFRVSTATSRLPVSLKATYALRGDFHTTLAGGRTAAYVAWSDAGDGATLHVRYASVPLSELNIESAQARDGR